MSTAIKPKIGSIYLSKVDPESCLMWIHVVGPHSDENYASGPQLCFDRTTGEFFSVNANASIDPKEHDLIWESTESAEPE